MPIDPSAFRYNPTPLENPLNAMAQMSQIQNYQQTNQLNQMKMEEARLKQANVNAMNNAYKDAFNPETNSVDYNRLYKSLAASGQGSRIPGVQKLQFEGQQAGANLQKTQGEVRLQNTTAALERVGNLEWNPSDANITSHIEDSIKRGDVTPAQGSAKLAEALSVPLDQRPAYFRQLGLTIKQRQDAADKVADRGVTTAGQKSVAGTAQAGQESAARIAADRLLPMTPEVMEQEMRLRAAGRTPATAALKDPKQIAFDQFRKENPNATSAELYAAITDSQEKPRKPLTELQLNKLRTDMGKDHSTAVTMLSQMEDVLDSARAVRTSKGLGAATGYSGAYLPSWTGSDAAFADTRIANLRGKITGMGKAAAAMSGAIGPMAVQEWKILADQVAVIDLVKGKGPLLEQVNLLEAQAEGAIQRIRDKYETVRGEDFDRFPQFNKLPAPKVRTGNPRVATGVVNTAPASGSPPPGFKMD